MLLATGLPIDELVLIKGAASLISQGSGKPQTAFFSENMSLAVFELVSVGMVWYNCVLPTHEIHQLVEKGFVL